MEPDKICINCRFFDPFKDQKKQDSIIGSCKYNAPIISSNPRISLGVWPQVLGSFWCGAHESKTGDQNA